MARRSTRSRRPSRSRSKHTRKGRTSAKGRRSRRNPSYDPDFVHHFRKGGRIELFKDGEVCIYDAIGNEENYFIKPYQFDRLKKDILGASHGAWHHYTQDMVSGDYEFQGRGGREKRNPGRGRRGKRRGRNPYARPGENDIPTVRIVKGGGKGRRNPGVFHRMLHDGSKVTVHDSGEVVVHDESGREFSRYRVKAYEVPRLLKDLGHAKRATKGHYRGEDMADEYHSLQMNPRRGRSTKGVLAADAKLIHRHMAKGRYTDSKGFYHQRKSHRKGAHRHRRNPAQFPAPFVSAMNPGRTRRNHPISRRDVGSIKRVLRQHRHSCR